MPRSRSNNDRGVFLIAQWRNLLMLNYAVDPAVLLPFVPDGVILDRFEGVSYVSLVAFQFLHTRVRGVAIPFHTNFEEVNLRFYVHRDGKRGVVFLSELVPKRAIALIARLVYNEHYSFARMSHSIGISEAGESAHAEYRWQFRDATYQLQAELDSTPYIPADGSLSQFITEHYWGYAAQRGGGCLEYEVRHPRWHVRQANRASFEGDAIRLYGSQLAGLLVRPPDSAFLAEGSEVSVFRGRRLV